MAGLMDFSQYATNRPQRSQYISTGVPSENASGDTKGWFGIDNSDWLGAGLTILGGALGSRDSNRQNRQSAALTREQIAAQRAMNQENIRGGMQRDQDAYAREIMRNRAAISPWRQMYQGPAFTQANPNAPVYNPLMEQGHLFNTMGAPPNGG